MKQRNLWKMGILSLTLVFGLFLGACEDTVTPETDTTYTVSADGNATTTSTKINFTFAAEVSGLTANDITLGTGVTKGTLSGGGKNWSLGITVNTAGSIAVSINKSGIESASKTVTVYKASTAGNTTGYTLLADGDVSTASTKIDFTFVAEVSGLTANDITLGTGVTKGTLTGSGKSWSLGITVTTPGSITVSISKSGIESGTKSVTVYKAPATGTTGYTPLADGDVSTASTKIDFTFAAEVSGLTANDITLGTGVTKGTLTGSGKSWSLGITVTTPGSITVSINKDGIDNTSHTVIVWGTPQDTTYTVSADGNATTTSTKIDFAFAAEVSGLTADVITLGTGVTKGALSGDGKNWSLGITVNTAGSIAVSINKSGIESASKSVTVYKASSNPGTDPDTETPITGGANSGAAAELTLASADNARWYGDTIAASGVKWYKFTAQASKTYHVQWWDTNSQPTGKGKTAWVKTTAYQSNGTTTIDDAWTTGWEQIIEAEITGQNGTVYLKVEPYAADTTYNQYSGTYALRVYDIAALAPQNPIKMAVGYPSAMAKNAVYVSWSHYVPDAAVTKYEVLRSTTQTGGYTKVGEVANSGTFIASVYIDESVTSGRYWYQVKAVNAIGDGATSAAVQSDTVGAHSSSATSVSVSTTGAVTQTGASNLTEGTVTAGSVVWYKFTGDATGGTYKVQFADFYYPSTGTTTRYTGDVYLSVFKADGSYAKRNTLDFRRQDTGWTSAQINDILNVAANETIYLKFEPHPSRAGTFGFKVWKDLVTTYSATPDGSATATTTKIDFVFSDNVSGLTASNITLGTGVSKGTLTGSGKNWSLGITVTTPGTISVAINKTGIESVSKTVTVYKAAAALKADPYPLPTSGGTVIKINWTEVLGGTVKKAYVVVYEGAYTASSVPVAWSYGNTVASGSPSLDTRMVNYSDNSSVWTRDSSKTYTIWVLVAKTGAADYRDYDAYRTSSTVASADLTTVIPNSKFNSTIQTTGPNMP